MVQWLMSGRGDPSPDMVQMSELKSERANVQAYGQQHQCAAVLLYLLLVPCQGPVSGGLRSRQCLLE
jgi:hypothetical protein